MKHLETCDLGGGEGGFGPPPPGFPGGGGLEQFLPVQVRVSKSLGLLPAPFLVQSLSLALEPSERLQTTERRLSCKPLPHGTLHCDQAFQPPTIHL